MKKILITGGVVMGIIAPLIVFGAQFQGGQSYTLPKGQVAVGNMYAAGGNVVIAGDVMGDLTVAGGTVLVNGTVNQDLLGGGGTVDLLGSVKGDVRIIGGNVTIGGDIGGELVAAGGTVHLISGAVVHGGVTIAGGNVTVDGDVNSMSRVFGGEVSVNGHLFGDLLMKGGKLTIGSGAVITGKLDYESPQEAVIDAAAKITGPVSFHKTADRNTQSARTGLWVLLGAWWFVKSLMLIVAGLVALKFFGRSIQNHLEGAIRNFGKEMFWGFATAILVPIAILILFVSVVGILLGALGLLTYVLVILAAKVYAAIITGSIAHKFFFKRPSYAANWQALVIGVIVLQALTLLPILGWLLASALWLIAFGNLSHSFIASHRKSVA